MVMALAMFVHAEQHAVAADCEEPLILDGTFRLGEATVPPGAEVTIPFTLEASNPVDSYSISVDFDEEVLEAVALERVFVPPGGGKFGYETYGMNNKNATPGNAGVDEGYLGALVVFSNLNGVTEDAMVPPGIETTILNLKFRVRPGVRGVTTELRFLDGARYAPQKSAVFSTIGMCGNSYPTPELNDSFIFIDGRIAIIDEIAVFIRGDADGDGKVMITDPIRTLGHLFGSGQPVACTDAADSNDDGKLDISDPIATLDFLFLGTMVLPPPTSSPGADPTPDSLWCLPVS